MTPGSMQRGMDRQVLPEGRLKTVVERQMGKQEAAVTGFAVSHRGKARESLFSLFFSAAWCR